MNIEEYLKSESLETKAILDAFISQKIENSTEHGDQYHDILTAIHKRLLLGGKLIRPTLIRLAFSLSNQRSDENVLKVSAAFEILHRFLLVHDDIFDRDQLRHGGPTLEKAYQDRFRETFPDQSSDIYGKGIAMIGGDLIHTFAYDLIIQSGFESTIINHAITAFNQCLSLTVAGWLTETELKFTSLDKITESEIMQAMKLVSAHYSVLWPLRIGQICSASNPSTYLEPLEVYGRNIGLAFQIQDDILALTGNSTKMGKKVGNDLQEGKKSIVLLKAFNRSNKDDQQFLQSTLGKDIDQQTLNKVQSILKKTSALEDTQKLQNKLANKGISVLDELPSTYDQTAIERLKQIAIFLTNRSH